MPGFSSALSNLEVVSVHWFLISKKEKLYAKLRGFFMYIYLLY